MKIVTERLSAYLEKHGMTGADFALEIGVTVSEVERLLAGAEVDVHTARRFIHHLGADTAQGLIDWGAIGKKNPFEGEDAEEDSDNV